MWRFMPTSFPFDLYGGWFHPVGHFGVLSAKGKGIEAHAGNAGLRGVPRISQLNWRFYHGIQETEGDSTCRWSFAPPAAPGEAPAPLVHCITNYVTARDCANLLLACGASPVMADDVEEVAEITAVSSGLYLNLGTLHRSSASAMLAAGTRAGAGHPVLLDPVGVGASRCARRRPGSCWTPCRLPSFRGNASEIKTLVLGSAGARGVDADITDQVTQENLEATAALAQTLAGEDRGGCGPYGAVDVVTDGDKAVFIRNGHPMMCRVTGMGCQLSALTAAFVAANPDKPLEGAVAAVCVMGLCGEMAFARLSGQDGTASFGVYLMDAISA